MKLPGGLDRILSSEGRQVGPVGIAGSLVLLGSLLFYWLTLAPTVIWGDSAAFAIQALDLKLSFGAEGHPLFILLGWLFCHLPFEPAYCLNLLSAVTASLTVMVVYFIVFELTDSIPAAIIGAVSLMLSHSFWLHAVIAEVYDLNGLFVALVTLVLLRWSKAPDRIHLIFLAAFLFGLGLSNHLVLALEAMGFLVFVLATSYRMILKTRTLLLAAISFLGGSGIVVFLCLRKMLAGQAASVLADAATGGSYKQVMGILSLDIIRDFMMYLAYLFYQFPVLAFFLGFAGLATLIRRDWKKGGLLLLLIGTNMLFFLSFGPGVQSTTKYTFYISDYVVFSILIGYGAWIIVTCPAMRRYSPDKLYLLALGFIIFCPLSLYSLTPAVSKTLGIDLLHTRTIPYRDNEVFFLNPNKRGYVGAELYARDAFAAAGPGSTIIADYTPRMVLLYFQKVHGIGQGVDIRNSGDFAQRASDKTLTELYGKKDVFFAGIQRGYYRTIDLMKEYEFEPIGVLYKIRKRVSGATDNSSEK